MATKGLRRTIDRLRHSLVPADLTDEQLLQRFLGERSEAAFASLVRRHGPMILGVCQRVLGNLHDSEDVFQATFLVLAQKARSVVKGESLSSWLYKVAYRIALKLRVRNARRHQREKQVAVMPDPRTTPAVVADWEVLLDEELNRLPEKYRTPLILCDLEGRTGKEAESRLRIAAGTLSSRLTTARRLLAERLTRRGLSLSAGALATALSEAAAAAAPSPGLVGSTAKTAVLVSTGQLAGISSSVLVLMKLGAKAMFLAKLKATLATIVVLAFVGGGIVYSGGAKPAQPKNDSESLLRENELLKVNLRATLERIETLEKQLAEARHAQAGLVEARQLRQLLEAERARTRLLEQADKVRHLEVQLDLPRRQKAQADMAAVLAALAKAKDQAKDQQQRDRIRQLEDAATILRKLADDLSLPPSTGDAARRRFDLRKSKPGDEPKREE